LSCAIEIIENEVYNIAMIIMMLALHRSSACVIELKNGKKGAELARELIENIEKSGKKQCSIYHMEFRWRTHSIIGLQKALLVAIVALSILLFRFPESLTSTHQ
jgi:hypothetical protein